MKQFKYLLLLLLAPLPLWAIDPHVAASTSRADVQAAIDAAHDGDTVEIPAGSSTWTSNVTITSGKAVNLKGAGKDSTHITMASGAYLSVTTANGDFVTIEGIDFNNTSPLSSSGLVQFNGNVNSTPGFRLTNCRIDFGSSGGDSRGVRIIKVFGLIDNCEINGIQNFKQAITVWRSTSAGFSSATNHTTQVMWFTPQSMGTDQAVYVEDCTINYINGSIGDGALDAYDSSKFVFRFNTVTDTFMGWHGADSGDYPRAPRLWEIYKNTFTTSGPSSPYTCIRARGGTGVVWGNTIPAGAGPNSLAWFSHYSADPTYVRSGWGATTGSDAADGNFDGFGYPALDQIGRGSFPSDSPWYDAGITSYAGQQEDYQEVDPVYVFLNNFKGDLYKKVKVTGPSQTTNFVKEDRDMFHDLSGFDGTSGMGVGTKATMDGITPTLDNVGFWVTDEAEWNSEQAGVDGQLYKWNGSTWVLHYTPYTYPHPLQTGGAPDTTPPVVVTATVATNGTDLTIAYNESVTQGTGYNDSDLDLDASTGGNDLALTYSSGDGTSSHVYTIGTTILQGETVDLDFNGDADSLEDDAGNDLLAIVSRSVINNSSQTTPDVTAPLVTDVHVGEDGMSVQVGFDETTSGGAGGTGGFTLTGSVRGAQSMTWDDGVPDVIAGAKYMATTGNDGNDGSIGSPWLTLAYAVSQMSAGDALHIRGGTYVGAQTIAVPSGTSGDPTIIAGYPGETAILSGTAVSTGRYKLLSDSWVDLRDLTITLLNQGLWVEDSNNINVINVTVHNVGQEGIHVLDNSSNVLIEDCHVYDTRQWQFNGEGIYVGTGSGGPLDNTNNITIRNNLIHDTIDEGIELKPATHDCIVEGNTLYNIETASWFGAIEVGPTQLGAQSYGSNPNHIIRDNMIYDSDTAIVLDTGSQCYNNTIYNLSFDAIGILVDDPAADGYTMYIHHNTIDLPLARAYETQGGTSVVTNNIGPNLASNTPVDNAFFLAGVGNYQLAAGASVIDIGVMVTPTVINDDGYGNARMIGSKSDYGAHEFGGIFPMTNIQNFDVPLTFGTNDVITWAYVQPGDGWEDAAGNDLVGLSNQSVTNDSTQASQGGGGGTVPRAPKGVGVSSGFFQ